VKTFREFLQVREAGGIFENPPQPGDQPTPSGSASRWKDWNLKKFGAQGMYSGSIAGGLGNAQPQRMKKMKGK
jgi:hypothetical protein